MRMRTMSLQWLRVLAWGGGFCILLALWLAGSGCSGGGARSEAALKRTIKKMALSVEEGGAALLGQYLSQRYADSEGRDRTLALQLVEEYFDRYRGLGVRLLEIRTISLKGSRALMEVDCQLSAGSSPVFSKILKSLGAADPYRFNLELMDESTDKSGEWRVVFASWANLAGNDLSPAARELLSGEGR